MKVLEAQRLILTNFQLCVCTEFFRFVLHSDLHPDHVRVAIQC